jgi:DNA topoisomerase-1
MRLLIVESPAKCSKIQGFLGPGNQVIASMGCIRALVPSIDSVGIDRGFEPTYEFMKEKAKAIANLKAVAKNATQIILCADDDREGEAIAYSVALLLKLNVRTAVRVTFREITKNAVLDALAHPRTIDMNRVNSQQARSMLDMLIGFTISPILWKHLGYSATNALSAGRCQTPALRILCDMETKIQSFKTESSWALSGQWTLGHAAMIDPLTDEESALNYLENHSVEKGATIRSTTTKPWAEQPPQALMTSTLQQQTSNLFGINPKRTMQIAQKLYEAGHITYMRTDQTAMSKEAQEQGIKVIGALFGSEYIGDHEGNGAAQHKAQAKAGQHAQEAHEAIRPTHFEYSKLPEKEDWSQQEAKVYRLIWLRAIQSLMAKATGESRDLIFDLIGDDSEFPWSAKWRRTLFQGWKKANERDSDPTRANHGDEPPEESQVQEAEQAWKQSEQYKPGQRIEWITLKAQPKESKPPGRYTEASLVRELEKRGIGRPSTFASLIATLLDKSYAELQDVPVTQIQTKSYVLTSWPPEMQPMMIKRGGEKGRMVPTPLGKTLVEFVLKHFSDLFAYEFTSEMEVRLDKISEGTGIWKSLLEETWNSYKDRVSELKRATMVSVAGTPQAAQANPKRREFSGGLIAVMTAKGPLLLKEGTPAGTGTAVFYGWPKGTKTFSTLTEQEALAFVETVTQDKATTTLGEWNGHAIVKKKGPYGSYAECNGARITLTAQDTLETIIAKLGAKKEVITLGPFQVRTGQYGPYLMKPSTTKKKPQCVSIPKGTDIEGLTAQQAGEIYEAGLKKVRFKKD